MISTRRSVGLLAVIIVVAGAALFSGCGGGDGGGGGTGIITGTVPDAGSGQPLGDVGIAVKSASTQSRADGTVRLSGSPAPPA